MQTAVNFLIQQIESFGIDTKFMYGFIEQAKEMEKQQMIDAWNDGHSDGWNVRENDYNINYYKKSNGEEWYNYTFNYRYGKLK